VLFADIVGYTTLSDRLGEETLFAVMDEIYELFIHEVHRYEGTVNELTGDGVVAFFGAPLAVEQAPQRAVRAALAIQRELAAYNAKFEREQGCELEVRVGINTGPVIVGTVGNNLRMDYKAVGDTVNLAARMEQTAEAGTIQITENTHKLVAGYFRCEDLGLVDIKGKEVQIHVYGVLAERGARSRIDVERERGFTPFTGRERELELLTDAFERVKAGRGQAVSIVGEAGFGKSRLLHEFRNALAGQDVTFLEGRCSPHGATTAYLPVTEILRQNFRIDANDSDADIGHKVQDGLQALSVDPKTTAPYLVQLLSCDSAGAEISNLPPEIVKRRTFEALQRITLAGAERRPVVLTFEDLHWSDKTSEEAATFLLDHIAGSCVLLVFTYRPEFVSDWSRKSYHSVATLARLLRRESRDMLLSLLGTSQVQDELEEVVVEKSEGVPFFLEELVHSLRETGAIERQDGQWVLRSDADSLQVPATVHDVLTARIDRLPEGAKRVLQIGAVMGREFPWELVKAVAELREPELNSHIDAITDAELVYERGVPPEATYLFKHALTQDVAYDSLLLTSRREIHEQVAKAIVTRHGDDLGEWADTLAHHFAHSEDPAQALPYLAQAGEQAQRGYANAEAVAAFSKALEILDELPATDNVRRQRADLAVRLGSLHALLGHYGESQPFFARALEEAEAAGDLKAIARLETRIGRVRYSMGDNEGATACYEKALDLAKRVNDATRIAICYQSLADAYFTSGSLPKAIESLTNALQISEKAGNTAGVAAACTFLSNAHGRAGNLTEAVAWARRALALGESLHDDRRVVWACIMLAGAYVYAGEFGQVRPLLERALHLSKKVGDFRAIAWVHHKHRDFQAGSFRDFEKALEYGNHAIEMSKESGGFQHEMSAGLARAAEELVRLDRHREAFEYCHQGLAISLKASNKLEYGYAYKVLAEVHASEAYRDWDKAVWYLEESVKAFTEAGSQLHLGQAHLAGARVALQRQDGMARQWAEKAKDIFAECGAKGFLKETEEFLGSLE
jgi:class 3 adenylate cyclase/tetratricopeptide (TPR) repeat protein